VLILNISADKYREAVALLSVWNSLQGLSNSKIEYFLQGSRYDTMTYLLMRAETLMFNQSINQSCIFRVVQVTKSLQDPLILMLMFARNQKIVGLTVNKAVIDRRLRPRCCHVDDYFKHTSFSCGWIRKDIRLCKHDVINIQHAHCGLVGSECKK